MGIFIAYMIKSGFCLLLFYLLYKWQLAKETFFRLNRIMLLGFWILAFLLPAIPLVNWGNTDLPAGLDVNRPEILNSLTNISLSAETNTDHQAFIWTWLICTGYIVGVVLIASKQLVSWLRLYLLIRRGRRIENGPFHLILTEGNQPPFSWMHYIVLSEKDYRENPTEILTHEMAHIRHHHSWDLLLADIGILLQWFNPAAWLLKQEMQSVHEYEADDAVLAAGVDAKSYQLLLIKKAVGTSRYTMANSFNHSKLKKRITMMQRRKSNPWARAKLLYVLPLAAVAVAAFARPEVSGVSNQLSDAKVTDLAEIVKEKTVESVPQDTVKADGLQGKNSTVYDMVEQAPAFPGGPQAMMQFIKDNLQYPQIAKENGIQGRVILQFVVDETGKVTDPKVIRSIDPSLDTEAIRLVLSMPRWIPGMQDGKAVAVRYTIPVIFKLETAEETSSKDGVLSIKAGNMSEVSGEISKLLMNSDSLVILVDGVPATEETLHALSADKIATMSILKDKLDGMAAAKGKKTVIAIATDSGKPSIVVSGAVVDEKGGPILGALVRVVGSVKKGVVTDGQGNFTITVPEGCSLEVSYIDHQTTVVKAQPEMTVTLKAE